MNCIRDEIIRDNQMKYKNPFKELILPLLFFWFLLFSGCREHRSGGVESGQTTPYTAAKNLLSDISKNDLGGLKWLNAPEKFELLEGTIIITAKSQTDFFINPVDLNKSASAPLLYKEVAGDFVAVARVTPDMSSQWNAAALMVLLNDRNWIKFGFENSDATGPGIVTVITRETSDDANGPILNNVDNIWLKLVRKGHNYSMHWSYNGSDYNIARLAAMPETDSIKVGIEAQCPDGSEAKHRFDHFSIEAITVEDIRKGE